MVNLHFELEAWGSRFGIEIEPAAYASGRRTPTTWQLDGSREPYSLKYTRRADVGVYDKSLGTVKGLWGEKSPNAASYGEREYYKLVSVFDLTTNPKKMFGPDVNLNINQWYKEPFPFADRFDIRLENPLDLPLYGQRRIDPYRKLR